MRASKFKIILKSSRTLQHEIFVLLWEKVQKKSFFVYGWLWYPLKMYFSFHRFLSSIFFSKKVYYNLGSMSAWKKIFCFQVKLENVLPRFSTLRKYSWISIKIIILQNMGQHFCHTISSWTSRIIDLEWNFFLIVGNYLNPLFFESSYDMFQSYNFISIKKY